MSRLNQFLWSRGFIPEELDDPRSEPDFWLRTPLLPVRYRGGVHSNGRGNVFLEETEVETSLLEVVAQSDRVPRIYLFRWFLGSEREWQECDATVNHPGFEQHEGRAHLRWLDVIKTSG